MGKERKREWKKTDPSIQKDKERQKHREEV